jgi:crotonobetainyl-CoA:carnitine CoA-transferase CaiB-like acyl-CoA transferase
LEPIIIEALSHGTTDEWIKKFEEVAIPCGRINDIGQAAENPQLLYRNMFVDLPCPSTKGGVLKVSNSPLKLSRTPPQVTKGAPNLGDNTEDVLSSLLEMDQNTINSLKQNHIITREETLT